MAKPRKVVTSQKLNSKTKIMGLWILLDYQTSKILEYLEIWVCTVASDVKPQMIDVVTSLYILCCNGLSANSIESNEILHSIQKLIIEIPT